MLIIKSSSNLENPKLHKSSDENTENMYDSDDFLSPLIRSRQSYEDKHGLIQLEIINKKIAKLIKQKK